MKKISLFAVVLPCLLSFPAHADVLFYDGFDGTASDVDRSLWTSPAGDAASFGRTTIRNPSSIPNDGLPATVPISDGIAQLRLDTFNPTSSFLNRNFWGSEIDTIQKWQPENGEAIRFEARVKIDGSLPSGLLTSVFAYGLTGSGPANKDEIDFEFPSKQPGEVLTNHFLDQPATAEGSLQSWSPGNIKVDDYNVFRIDWYPDKIDWYVNNALLASTSENVPTDPMGLNLNIWVPDSHFAAAYDPSLQPADSLEGNKTYFYDVDWVQVSSIPVPEPPSLALLLPACAVMFLRKRTPKMLGVCFHPEA